MATPQRILVPTDFSEVTRVTLERARALADPARTELHVLHAAPNPGLSLPGGDEAERRSQELRERLERIAQPAALDGLAIVCVARMGKPWMEIVTYAREAQIDLIVMGTHGRTGLVHAVMGSVVEQVVRHAPCPVLIVRPPSEGPEAVTGEAAAPREREPQAAPEAAQHHAEAVPPLFEEALGVLRTTFGDMLEGERPETWGRMVYVLGRDLDLEPPEAGRLLSDLESAHRIVWRGGFEAEGDEAQAAHWVFRPEGAEGQATTEFRVLDQDESPPSASIDLLQRALIMRATDIHIDPTSTGRYQVRLRIDGRLEPFCELDSTVAQPLVQQFKVMGSIDITEPFEPKEGRLALPANLADIEVRLTSSPVQGGTAVALRVQQRTRIVMSLEALGLFGVSKETVEKMLKIGDGLILVTGPTNAGKTTTIYSLLAMLSGGGSGRNLVSIEDPIEYPLPFIRQVAVDLRHNLTLAQGLRTVLRMDPDVVFVSEIRDAEAAEIAMRAASSGRFVLSTLHTRDAASTVTALRDLHVDNRSLGGNLTGLVSQRLARRLCPRCVIMRPPTRAEAAAFAAEGVEPPAELGRPVGCDHCRGSGHLDRVGIFEAVITDGAIRDTIDAGATEEEVRTAIRAKGTPSLMADALTKARDGIISFQEARDLKWA